MFQLSKFAEQLAELMNEQQCTQAMVAEAIQTSRSNFSLYLNAKHAPNYENFIRLIEYFNCSADYLIGTTDYPNQDNNYKKVGNFATRLRTVLKEENYTQYSFIKKSKISWSVFSYWLKGKSLPSLDNLLKIAQTMEISLDRLLGREP